MSNLIGQRVSQYEITALLGKGGMAAVYRARQLNIRREVAIKVIKSDLTESPDFVMRFEREAETIASLRHPHILKLFDYGQEGEVIYLVMELVSGGSLSDLIRQGPLPIDTTSRLLDQIASALDYAHKRGIIHRDLKPQNILLDEEGNAVLTDFGIAKLLRETTALTQSGHAMGTPSYMAPEQWRGRAIDARTDIYALGVTVFEMLTGRLPFIADTPFSMMHQHIYEPPPPVRQLNAGVPPGVEQVIDRGLAKEPEQRYQSASEMAQAFKSMLHSAEQPPAPARRPPTPVLPPPDAEPSPTLAEFVPEHKRTSRRGLIVIAAILVLLLAGGALFAALSGGRSETATPSRTAAVTFTSVAAAPTTALSPTSSSTSTLRPTVLTATRTVVPPTSTQAATSTATIDAAAMIAASMTQMAAANAKTIAAYTRTPTATRTPDTLQTAAVGKTLTAIVEKATIVAGYTKTPTTTFTPTLTPTPTLTRTALTRRQA